MEEYNEQLAYKRAKKKVQEIKGFYLNLMCYCLIIPILVYINLTYSPGFHWFWFSALGWGTGVLFHGISAFNVIPFLGCDWEERKMREFMQQEERNAKKNYYEKQ